MRLFIAAELPQSMLDALAETSAVLRASVRGRFVGADSFHITLAFLGQVESHRVDDIQEALNTACASFGPIPIELGELGSFGKSSKATLWQGVRDSSCGPGGAESSEGRGVTDEPQCATLAGLAQSVRSELANRDFAFDNKSFLPHVTLMRAADLSGGTLPAPYLAAGMLESVTLFRSDLSGEHPVYEPLYRADLMNVM